MSAFFKWFVALALVVPAFANAQERIEMPEKGFSIVPPAGWEVVRDHPGMTLMLRAPKAEKQIYQRSMQVTVYGGSKPIDEISAHEFEEKLVHDFGAATRTSDFRIRNHQVIETESGANGLLFYTEFTVDSVPLMQAHLLVSSKTRHYLVTFTDLAQGFDIEGSAQTLPEAWTSMISIKTDSVAGGRFDTTITIASIFIVLGLVIGGVSFVKYRRAADEYKDLAGDLERQANLEDEDDVVGRSHHKSKASKPKASIASGTLHDDSNAKTRISGMDDDNDDADYDTGRVG